MPLYWSSSKVGALPQGQPSSDNKTKKSPEKKGRRKGITMEDLKKQTALRLAQEQQQQQQHGFSFQPHEPTPFQVVQPVPQSSEPPPQRLTQTAALTDRIYSHNHTGYNNSVPPHSATQPPNNIDAKAKLPHGLTVQELKEMTKARLQTECADIPEDAEVASVHSPSSMRFIPEYQDPRALQPSPFVRPGSTTSRSPFPDDHRDSWSQDGTRGDPWDAASVGTATSDYLGSEYGGESFRVPSDHEYAIGLSFSGTEHRDEPILAQSRSFATGIDAMDRQSSTASPYGRFMTASPGLNLAEQVVRNGPTVPSFSSIRQSSSVNSPSLMEPTRSRTFSLPAMNESPVPGLREGFDPLQGYSSTQDSAAPQSPRLIGGANPILSQSNSADQRHRASTWSGDDDIFLFGQNPSAPLSDDLAAILKLSGAEDKS